MCILIAKPFYAEMPDKRTFENCFNANKDGCGYAYQKDGTVILKKGFMTLKSFLKSVNHDKKDMEDSDCLFHFRIATTGSVIAGNCHPFPITRSINDLRALNGTYDRVIGHNGVIPALSGKNDRDLSDTMLLVKMIRSGGLIDRNVRQMLSHGKFVILSKNDMRTYGEFIEEDGVFYSNDSYLSFKSFYCDYDYEGTCYDREYKDTYYDREKKRKEKGQEIIDKRNEKELYDEYFADYTEEDNDYYARLRVIEKRLNEK